MGPQTKQIAILHLTGVIEVVTGLHIGAGNNAIEIGGMDNPVVRNPLTNEPYIPGSSIKGKMRSLAEWAYGKIYSNGETPGAVCSCGNPDCHICRIFGTNAARNEAERKLALQRGPTRVIVRDAKLITNEIEPDDRVLVEEKWENTINRITAEANPRQIERVVPSTCFNFDLSYRVIDDGDDGKKDREFFESVVLLSLYLLELDFLGGGGSRGNGKIVFKSLMADGQQIKDSQGNWDSSYEEKIKSSVKLIINTSGNKDEDIQSKD
ncbi:MAG: type III-A CRISPR-associated RAMP protein Csm3 [Deltaproteobacteria bacterium]|nr:type III-A CRISPR-associated RAMP protein Csm3 [Deltaproteobacteria bacterium]